MSFYAELDGDRIIQAVIAIPFYGAWTADVLLEHGIDVNDGVALTVGTLTLSGTTFASAIFQGKTSARIVGGKNGWSKTVDARSYYQVTGLKLSTVLGDAARDCGEVLGSFSEETLGTSYVRISGPAMRVLAGRPWWIDFEGKTQVTARPDGVVASLFDTLSSSSGDRRALVATEQLDDWVPNRTFSSPQIGSKLISSVVHRIDAKEIRTEVYFQ